MSPFSLSEVERAARAATPGPWEESCGEIVSLSHKSRPVIVGVEVERCYEDGCCDHGAHLDARSDDLSYIAAASPDRVLALCNALRGVPVAVEISTGAKFDLEGYLRLLGISLESGAAKVENKED